MRSIHSLGQEFLCLVLGNFCRETNAEFWDQALDTLDGLVETEVGLAFLDERFLFWKRVRCLFNLADLARLSSSSASSRSRIGQ